MILLTLFSFNVFFVAGTESGKDEIPLKKGEYEDPKTNRPRTPVLIPVMCYYDNGVVSLIPLDDLGEVQLKVTNQSSGITWYNMDGDLWVSTSTANGVYLVEIITEDGTTYWGTYTL